MPVWRDYKSSQGRSTQSGTEFNCVKM